MAKNELRYVYLTGLWYGLKAGVEKGRLTALQEACTLAERWGVFKEDKRNMKVVQMMQLCSHSVEEFDYDEMFYITHRERVEFSHTLKHMDHLKTFSQKGVRNYIILSMMKNCLKKEKKTRRETRGKRDTLRKETEKVDHPNPSLFNVIEFVPSDDDDLGVDHVHVGMVENENQALVTESSSNEMGAPLLIGNVQMNEKPVTVLFDSCASNYILYKKTAAKLGATMKPLTKSKCLTSIGSTPTAVLRSSTIAVIIEEVT